MTDQENTMSPTRFTKTEIQLIVLFASFGSFILLLTTNIYFPALDVIAKDLNVSQSKLNLSVITYMIFQGLTPMFLGSFSDSVGRRPVYFMSLAIYLVTNIALALQSTFTSLLELQCVQNAGSSGPVSLAAEVVADIVTSEERGSYIGYSKSQGHIGSHLAANHRGTLFTISWLEINILLSHCVWR